jgi:hypothetical protein
MKFHAALPASAAALGCATLLLFCGCTRSSDASTTTTVTDVNVTPGTPDAWDRIKDYTYDRRAEFSASFDRMSQDMDDHTASFRAKLDNVPDATARERESSMREYDDARANLKATRTELDRASADTWADAKSKTSEAWTKTKVAYDKVTRSYGH